MAMFTARVVLPTPPLVLPTVNIIIYIFMISNGYPLDGILMAVSMIRGTPEVGEGLTADRRLHAPDPADST